MWPEGMQSEEVEVSTCWMMLTRCSQEENAHLARFRLILPDDGEKACCQLHEIFVAGRIQPSSYEHSGYAPIVSELEVESSRRWRTLKRWNDRVKSDRVHHRFRVARHRYR